MIKEGKFGPMEAICLMTIAISGKVFFTSPARVVSIVGTAGWMMSIISASTTILFFIFAYLLAKRFSDKDLVEIFEETLGKPLGFIFSISICIATMYIASIRIREFSEVLKTYTLPKSPPSFIVGIFIIGILVLSHLGLESIARLAKLLSYSLAMGLILVLALSYKNYEVYRLFPILGYGVKPIVKNGILRSSAYFEIVFILFFAKSLQGTKYIKKVGFTSLILSGIIITTCLLAFSLTFPYYTALEVTSPMYQLTTLIDYGRFLQRVDPVFLFIWTFSTFISVALLFYVILSIYCKVFRIPDMRPCLIPTGVILFTLCMLPEDIATLFKMIQLQRNYSWLIFYAPILLTFFVALIRKKGANNNA